jgi:hypothetical protein
MWELAPEPGLPDGRGHGQITQNRQYKNISGRGKLPESGREWLKPSFYYCNVMVADFLVG